MATEKPDQTPRTPSIRQKVAAEIISEKIRKKEKVVIGEVLKEAGFSESTQLRPSTVTKTKTWQQLLDKTLKEKGLLKTHKALLNHSSLNHYTFPNAMTDQEITKIIVDGVPGARVLNIHRNSQWARAHFSAPDGGIRVKSLELAYKIAGKLKSEDDGPKENEEIREVVFRIRKLLPQAGQ